MPGDVAHAATRGCSDPIGRLAPRSRGDAPAGRRPARAAAPAGPPVGRRRGRRALRLPDAIRGVGSTARCGATCASSTARRRWPVRRSAASTRLHRGDHAAPGYRARDPELAMWVHATLVDSTMAAYDAWLRPARRGEADAVLRGDAPDRCGVRDPGRPAIPADLDAFDAYVDEMLGPVGPVHVSPTARDLADGHPPPAAARAVLGRLPRPDRGCTTGRCGRRSTCCPPAVRAEYGFPDGPLRSSRARAGSWPAGGHGARSCRRASARCRRRSPRTGASPASAAIGRRRPQ